MLLVYISLKAWYVFNGVADAAVTMFTLDPIHNIITMLHWIIPTLAGGVTSAPVVQYSDALPGGALELQVYSGADGSFVFVEDDGETLDYESGSTSTIKTTTYEWSDKSKTLSWKVVSFKAMHILSLKYMLQCLKLLMVKMLNKQNRV